MKKFMFLFLMFVSFIGNAQQEEITKFIKTESVGGKLDFTEVAEQQAKGAYFIMFDNVLYNKKDFAIVMWAAKVKSLGITKLKTATQLWEECYSRKLTDPEKKALKKGFEIKLEN